MTVAPARTSKDAAPLADKLEKLAEGLTEKIKDGRRPMTQNMTPKRNREFQSRVHDADNLERGQRALRALARAWREDRVPVSLRGLKTKADILPLVAKKLEVRGYYDVYTSAEYLLKSPEAVALQTLMESSESIEERAARQVRETSDRVARMIAEIRFAEIPGFFPTPREIVEQMVELARVEDGMDVLEPSAGKGDIIDVIVEKFPGVRVQACEIRTALGAILRAKYPKMNLHGDFLGLRGQSFDRIIMNPPFENGQDMEHVQHAWNMLRVKGVIVSVMIAGPFYRSDRKSVAFQGWLAEVNAEVTDLPDDAFAKGFKPTNVKCKLVVIRK